MKERRKHSTAYRQRNRNPRTHNPTWIWRPFVVVVVALIVVFLSVVMSSESPAGRFGADHTYWNFGEVSQGVVSHSFIFENQGDSDLILYGAWTSCGCTSAIVIIEGVESPKFGMHSNPTWTGRISSLGTAMLIVEYDALVHLDLYVGERSVFLKTNDPAQPEVEFRIAVSEI